MEFHKMKKVVIVTEASILDDVIEMVMELGASGYTITGVAGKGSRGGASPGISALRNVLKSVRIDIVTSEEIAKKIAVAVVERFLRHYAGIVYIEDVEIIRLERFQLYQ